MTFSIFLTSSSFFTDQSNYLTIHNFPESGHHVTGSDFSTRENMAKLDYIQGGP